MVTPDYHFFARSTSYNVSTDSLLLAMKALALCLHLSLLTISDSFQVQSTNGNHVKVATSMTAAGRDGDLSRRTFAQAFSGMAIASIFVGRVEASQAFASCKYSSRRTFQNVNANLNIIQTVVASLFMQHPSQCQMK